MGGAVHAGGAAQDTVDAFDRPNGRQLLATADEMAAVRDHLASWAPPERDYRDAVRKAAQLGEAELFGTGLNQPQIIEALAEELVESLLMEATDELDVALDECSAAILTNV